MCGVEFSDAPLPSEFGLVKALGAMVQLEYEKCLHFWFTSLDEKKYSARLKGKFNCVFFLEKFKNFLTWRATMMQGDKSTPFELGL